MKRPKLSCVVSHSCFIVFTIISLCSYVSTVDDIVRPDVLAPVPSPVIVVPDITKPAVVPVQLPLPLTPTTVVLAKAPTNVEPVAPIELSTTTTTVPSTTLFVFNSTVLTNVSTPSTTTTEHPYIKHDPLGTKMLLYTRKNPVSPYLLVAGDSTTVESCTDYNPLLPTRVILHGSFDGPDHGQWMKEMRNRILQVEDCNVILVDWNKGASASQPEQRVTNARMVGDQVAIVLKDLQKYHGMDHRNCHIISHSLGTFAASACARKVEKLGRITGLDPGGPNFDLMPADMRLSKRDAVFVDVYHTDAANATDGLYGRGTMIPIGHMDFYPNGGYDQPGCTMQRFEDLVFRPIAEGVRRFIACHHYRSIDYYLDSLVPSSGKCQLLGFECDNYNDFLEGKCNYTTKDTAVNHNDYMRFANFGFNAYRDFYLYNDKFSNRFFEKPRKFYMVTSRRKPFCLYHYNITVNFAPKPEQIRGGVLALKLVGEYGEMETRINGGMYGFNSGNSTGVVATNVADIGAVRSLSCAWMPAPSINLFTDPTIHIRDISVTPMSFPDEATLKSLERKLCPSTQNGTVSPFYRETFFPNC